jgi:hypothetical protein
VELFAKAQGASVKQLRIVPPKYAPWLTKAEVNQIRIAIANLLGVAPPAPTPSPTSKSTATPTHTPPGATPEPSPSPP